MSNKAGHHPLVQLRIYRNLRAWHSHYLALYMDEHLEGACTVPPEGMKAGVLFFVQIAHSH